MRFRYLSRWLSASTGLLLIAGSTLASASMRVAPAQCAEPDGRVSATIMHRGVLYLGGSFSHVSDNGGAHARAGLAAVDAGTCQVLPWKANTNGDVNALKATGNVVYVGGDFTSIRGTVRKRIAAVNNVSGHVLAFRHNVDKSVMALTIRGGRLYAGGDFTRVDGTARSRLAAFNVSRGSLSKVWHPAATGSVLALQRSPRGHRIYVGGSFSALNRHAAYANLGALGPVHGTVKTKFAPHASFPVLSLATAPGAVFAGGDGEGGHLGIWNADGSRRRPIYLTDGAVQAVRVHGNAVYVGGHFTSYCKGNTGSGHPLLCDDPLSRRKLFKVSRRTGNVTKWAPVVNSPLGIFSAVVQPRSGDLWIGGDFTTINSKPHAHLARFSAP